MTRTVKIGDPPQFAYRSWGLTILSDLACPELPAAKASEDASWNAPDVHIRVGAMPKPMGAPLLDDGFSQAASDQYQLRLPDVGDFAVTDGQRITVAPRAGCNDELLRLYLYSQCFGALFLQRRQIVLHASAIETSKGALIFLGPSGAGKSTLAAGLANQGHKLLSEDMCVLRRGSHGGFEVRPGPMQLRLWRNSAELLGYDPNDMQKVWHLEDKLYATLPPEADARPVPVCGLYLLGVGDAQTVTRVAMSKPEQIAALLTNVFRGEYAAALGARPALLEAAAALLSGTQIFHLSRPAKGFTVQEQIAFLQKVHGHEHP